MVECRHRFEIRDMLHIAGISPPPSGHTGAMPCCEMSRPAGDNRPSGMCSAPFSVITRKSGCWTTSAVPSIRGHSDYPMMSGCTRFMLSPDTRVVAVDLNNVAGDKNLPDVCAPVSCICWPGRSPAGILSCRSIREEIRKNLDPRYHGVIFRRIEQ